MLLKDVWRLYISDLWINTVLDGAEFAMETINLMMFITEEAIQMASMATSTSIDRGNLDHAQETLDTVMVDAMETLHWIIFLYALARIPSWGAFYCFWLASRDNNTDMSEKIGRYKKLRDLGYNIQDYNVRSIRFRY